ncbi:Uncharacterised protein [Vibrio cholerae]|nr:Uncharacterised protein [Vibrio cholerae]
MRLIVVKVAIPHPWFGTEHTVASHSVPPSTLAFGSATD